MGWIVGGDSDVPYRVCRSWMD